jgi:lipopolysaccharide/colanic/teichoic acid biosynthesis glycosyltransferase
MYKLVRENVPGALVFQAVVELGWLFAAVIVAGKLGNTQWTPSANTVADIFLFALLIASGNLMFGFYRRAHRMSVREYVAREFLMLCVEFPIAYLLSKAMFGSTSLHGGHAYAVLYALITLMVVRQVIALPFARSIVPKRVLVLGTGPEAQALDASIAEVDLPRVDMVGFCSLGESHGTCVASDRIVATFGALETTVQRMRVDEIVVAVHEQRGGVLPLQMLLDCRLAGVQVTHLSRFIERVHRRLPIESLKASWLIYGRGFDESAFRRLAKRCVDVVVAIILLLIALPIMLFAALTILLTAGGPVISREYRVGLRGRPFARLTFRVAMPRKRADRDERNRDGEATSMCGRFLHRARIDELPLLINVIKGEMGLIGPHPERPDRVAALIAAIPFYAIRHTVAPGITGWAQVHQWQMRNGQAQDWQLRATDEGKQAEAIRKLEYDLYYVKNHTLVFDALIALKSVGIVVFGAGRRSRRRPS